MRFKSYLDMLILRLPAGMRTLAGKDVHKRWSTFLKLGTALDAWDYCIGLKTSILKYSDAW